MMVHEEARWVYLGIPKTASTALHHFLEQRGARRCGRQHEMRVPEEWWSWLVFGTTRNPFRRAWALWRMLLGDAAKGAPWAGRLPPDHFATFPAFVANLLRGPDAGIPVFQRTMSDWLRRVPRDVQVRLVPAEALASGLPRLGLSDRRLQVPRVNRTRGSMEDDYDRETLDAVREWGREDFLEFGYSLRLERWQRAPQPLRAGRLWNRVFGDPIRVVRGAS